MCDEVIHAVQRSAFVSHYSAEHSCLPVRMNGLSNGSLDFNSTDPVERGLDTID